MNTIIDLMMQHRSIRKFTDEPVREADLAAAVRAGQMASTSSSVQAYGVIRVNDPGTREKLVSLTGGQTKVAASGTFLIIFADARRHQLVSQRADAEYDTKLEAFLIAVIDASLFAQNLSLALESQGYGICYIGGLRNQLAEVDALLGLPDGVFPLFGLCAGKPAETPITRPRLPLDGVLFEDEYPTDEAILASIDVYDAEYRAYLAQRGAKPASWSDAMAARHIRPVRTDLAGYYAEKGADLG